MYCVIQKVVNKKENKYGGYKCLKVTDNTYTLPGAKPCTLYGYSYGEERFERPVKDAYKISIHRSFREKGAVKKQQWVICTMGYYDITEMDWAGEYVNSEQLKVKLLEMNMSEEELWDMVYEKAAAHH